MKLLTLVLLGCVFSTRAFPTFGGAENKQIKAGISFDVFISNIQTAFGSSKGQDEVVTEGLVDAFKKVLEERKDRDEFVTDECVKTFHSELTSQKAKGLKFIHFIDAVKKAFNKGKELSEDFLNDLKEKIEEKVSDIGSDFVDAFKSLFERINKHKKEEEETKESNLEIDVFVKAVFSAFGVNENIVSRSVVRQVAESFKKAKGINSSYISHWNKAFDSCKGDSIDINEFISILRSSGCTYVPSDCLRALKSSENSCAFPDGIWANLQNELDTLQNKKSTFCSEKAKTDIKVGDFLRAVFSAYGAKGSVVSQNFITKVCDSFSKIVDSEYVQILQNSVEASKDKNGEVSLNKLTSAIKSYGCSYVPVDCLEAVKSYENKNVFPDGIWNNLQNELDTLQNKKSTFCSEKAKTDIKVGDFLRAVFSAYGAKGSVVSQNFITKVCDSFSKIVDSEYVQILHDSVEASKDKNGAVSLNKLTSAIQSHGCSYVPVDCLEAVKSYENKNVFPNGIWNNLQNELDTLQNKKSTFCSEKAKTDIKVGDFLRAVFSAYGAKGSVVSQNFITKVCDSFSKIVDSEYVQILQNSVEASKDKNGEVSLNKLTSAIKSYGCSYVPVDCLEAVKSYENKNVFPDGIWNNLQNELDTLQNKKSTFCSEKAKTDIKVGDFLRAVFSAYGAKGSVVSQNFITKVCDSFSKIVDSEYVQILHDSVEASKDKNGAVSLNKLTSAIQSHGCSYVPVDCLEAVKSYENKNVFPDGIWNNLQNELDTLQNKKSTFCSEKAKTDIKVGDFLRAVFSAYGAKGSVVSQNFITKVCDSFSKIVDSEYVQILQNSVEASKDKNGAVSLNKLTSAIQSHGCSYVPVDCLEAVKSYENKNVFPDGIWNNLQNELDTLQNKKSTFCSEKAKTDIKVGDFLRAVFSAYGAKGSVVSQNFITKVCDSFSKIVDSEYVQILQNSVEASKDKNGEVSLNKLTSAIKSYGCSYVPVDCLEAVKSYENKNVFPDGIWNNLQNELDTLQNKKSTFCSEKAKTDIKVGDFLRAVFSAYGAKGSVVSQNFITKVCDSFSKIVDSEYVQILHDSVEASKDKNGAVSLNKLTSAIQSHGCSYVPVDCLEAVKSYENKNVFPDGIWNNLQNELDTLQNKKSTFCSEKAKTDIKVGDFLRAVFSAYGAKGSVVSQNFITKVCDSFSKIVDSEYVQILQNSVEASKDKNGAVSLNKLTSAIQSHGCSYVPVDCLEAVKSYENKNVFPDGIWNNLQNELDTLQNKKSTFCSEKAKTDIKVGDFLRAVFSAYGAKGSVVSQNFITKVCDSFSKIVDSEYVQILQNSVEASKDKNGAVSLNKLTSAIQSHGCSYVPVDCLEAVKSYENKNVFPDGIWNNLQNELDTLQNKKSTFCSEKAKTDIKVGDFLRAVFSAYGAKGSVVSQNFITKVCDSFSKIVDSEYVQILQNSVEASKDKNGAVSLNKLTSAIQSHGCSYVPVDCLEAVKSHENKNVFPDGIWNNLQNELDTLQNKKSTFCSEKAKTDIKVGDFLRAVFSAYGAKGSVVSQNFITKVCDSFSKIVDSEYVQILQNSVEASKDKNGEVSLNKLTSAIKSYGCSYVPVDCLEAVKSYENKNVFPDGIWNNLQNELDTLQNKKSTFCSEKAKTDIKVGDFLRAVFSAYGAKGSVVSQNFITKVCDSFSKIVDSEYVQILHDSVEASKDKNGAVSLNKLTSAIQSHGCSYVPVDCLEAVKSYENKNVFPNGIWNNLQNELDTLQNKKSTFCSEKAKTDIKVGDFLRAVFSAYGAKGSVVSQNFITKVCDSFSKIVDSEYVQILQNSVEASKDKNGEVSLNKLTSAIKSYGCSYVPVDCLEAVKSYENKNVFPDGIWNNLQNELDTFQNKKSTFCSEKAKTDIKVGDFLRAVFSAYGAKGSVVSQNFITKVCDSFSKIVDSEYVQILQNSVEASKDKNGAVSLNKLTSAIQSHGCSSVPVDCLEAVKSHENKNNFPEGIWNNLQNELGKLVDNNSGKQNQGNHASATATTGSSDGNSGATATASTGSSDGKNGATASASTGSSDGNDAATATASTGSSDGNSGATASASTGSSGSDAATATASTGSSDGNDAATAIASTGSSDGNSGATASASTGSSDGNDAATATASTGSSDGNDAATATASTGSSDGNSGATASASTGSSDGNDAATATASTGSSDGNSGATASASTGSSDGNDAATATATTGSSDGNSGATASASTGSSDENDAATATASTGSSDGNDAATATASTGSSDGNSGATASASTGSSDGNDAATATASTGSSGSSSDAFATASSSSGSGATATASTSGSGNAFASSSTGGFAGLPTDPNEFFKKFFGH